MQPPRYATLLASGVVGLKLGPRHKGDAMGLLDGKTGLILNIANDRSIATHIASNCIKQGARCGFGFLPMENIEKSQRGVKKAMEENGFADAWLHPCDVSSDESINTFFAAAKQTLG